MSILFRVFLSMLKIGCFAFGGGYAIIALLENEFISKRNFIDHDEFLDVVQIPLAEMVDAVMKGEILDGKTQLAVLKVNELLRREKNEK